MVSGFVHVHYRASTPHGSHMLFTEKGIFPNFADICEVGCSWGWGGAERGGEVGESPPPPTEAITVMATVSPLFPFAKAKHYGMQ